MLTPEENRTLTEVGPGTPCGELLRRYWLPLCPAAELSAQSPFGIRSQKRRDELGSKLAHVALEFVAADLRQDRQILGERDPDIGAELERQLQLAQAGGYRARTGRYRHDAKIIVAGLIHAPT